MQEILKEQKLFALSVLFFALLNYPLISVFNQGKVLMGIPIIFFYVFFCWLCIILLTAYITEEKTKKVKKGDE